MGLNFLMKEFDVNKVISLKIKKLRRLAVKLSPREGRHIGCKSTEAKS